MTLTELSAIKHYDNTIDIAVIVDRKQTYSFTIAGDYSYWQFKKLLPKKPGAALNYLKKWSIGKVEE
jgi:hypothetical protein